jgi:peptide/nickel transport system ATP-binding protein
VVVLQDGRVVEKGSCDEVLRAPREEYTRRLLAAAPVPDPAEQRARRAARRALAAPEGSRRAPTGAA